MFHWTWFGLGLCCVWVFVSIRYTPNAKRATTKTTKTKNNYFLFLFSRGVERTAAALVWFAFDGHRENSRKKAMIIAETNKPQKRNEQNYSVPLSLETYQQQQTKQPVPVVNTESTGMIHARPTEYTLCKRKRHDTTHHNRKNTRTMQQMQVKREGRKRCLWCGM